MKHPLHEAIGKELENLQGPLKMRAILSPECGGKKDIPLFIKEPKSAGTEICNVDAMVIKDGKIKIIIEIEESDTKPTQICGKYLTSNLAELYAYKKSEKIGIDMASVMFIQILDMKGFSKKSSKSKQFDHIEKAINDVIDTARLSKFNLGCIKKYKIIKIDSSRLKTSSTLFADFINSIKDGIE